VAPDLGAGQQRKSRFFLLQGEDLAMDKAWTGFTRRSGEDPHGEGWARPRPPSRAGWETYAVFPSSVVRVMQQDAMDRLVTETDAAGPELLCCFEPDVTWSARCFHQEPAAG